MRRLALFFLAVLAALPVQAADPAPTITKDIALKAIAAFRRDPASELGRGSAAIIVQFAEKSPDVDIKVTERVTPWIMAKPPSKHGPTLLAAFIAGNTRSQLESGVGKDDPLAGVTQVIETYRQLQRTDPQLKLPEVEKLIDLQTRGKLRAYLNGVDAV